MSANLNKHLFLATIIFCLCISTESVYAENFVEAKRKTSSIGIGLNGVTDWSTQFPFLNQMKLSREWYDWERNTTDGFEVDEHGWVTSIKAGVKPSTVFLTIETEYKIPIPYEYYIVRWEGKGRLDYQWCAKRVGKAFRGDRIKVGFGSCLLSIVKSDPKDPIRNISIVPEKYVELYDSGEIFNPDFIEKIKSFRAVRFMDWMSTNHSKQSAWNDRPLVEDRRYSKKGVPVEIMVQLANKITADPWFNMPHLSDLNYMENFASLVKAKLNPNLNVYVEHSNEVWNWVFEQAKFALESAKSIFGTEIDGAWMQWHGMRTAQMCEIWKQKVYKENSDDVICVLGAQASWPGIEQTTLDCPLWVAKGNKPCAESGIDAVAITGYFSGCLDGGGEKFKRAKIIGWQHSKDKGITKAYEQALSGKHFKCEDTIKHNEKNIKYHVNEARKRGMELLAYEGGQHITSNFAETQNDKRFIDLHTSLNRSAKMKSLYAENFKVWSESGGGLFMHFVDASAYTQYGSWGALEYITQESSPKWDALMEINRVPCWWKNCQKN
jgi:hypothetical protein